MDLARRSAFLLLLLLAACQAAGGDKPIAAPVSGVPASCERSCNSEYDSCMDRFGAMPGPQHLGGAPDDPANMQTPNGVCPDQLKSCLKRCSL